MNKTHLHNWAEEIIKKTGFILGKEIYRGYYYSLEKIRNLIFDGQYQGKPAILKIYDDPRLTYEPVVQDIFNKQNKSKILKAPEVYGYKVVSSKKGWLIMEKFSEKATAFKRPIEPENRKFFVELYLEYRKNFSIKPTRPLALFEDLSAHQLHVFRINRWFHLANDREAERVMSKEKPILNPKEFIPRFEKGLDLIRREFKNRKTIWCHGHFNPAEIFKAQEKDIYYLIDFAHAKMCPEGYEFAFIIWSDWIMNADWQMNYSEWKQGVDSWISEFRWAAKKLNIKRFQSLMSASLVERSLGAILADICASDGAREEKIKRIALIYKLLDEL